MLAPDTGDVGKLSGLYQNLCAIMGKDVNHLEPEIEAYLCNSLVREDTKGRKKGNDKGNLRRELPGMQMTWDVFKKGLRVLAPNMTCISVELKWNRNRTTRHMLRIATPKKAA